MTDRYGLAPKQCSSSIIMIVANVTRDRLREPFKDVRVQYPPWTPSEMLTNLRRTVTSYVH